MGKVCWNRSSTASLEESSAMLDFLKENELEYESKMIWGVQAYRWKALELANKNIALLCQSAHQGCTGIGCQLHPLKVNS